MVSGAALRARCLGLSLLAVWLTLAACQGALPEPGIRLENEGALYVYLQPFPPEAERLRVVIGGIAALHRDGYEVPLRASLRNLGGRETSRQRLLAAGPLPAGEYAGLVIQTTSAALGGEAGESALLVPEAPGQIDFAFAIRRREARVIGLALRPGEAVEASFRFSPAFAAYLPDRPAVGRMGFVANRRSSDVTVFDKRARQVFDVIATGREPSGMALDQRRGRLYVAVSGENGIDVIDVPSGQVTERIRLRPGDEPSAVALTPDGRTLISANRGSNTVSLVDPEARFELGRVPTGNGPRGLAVDRTGGRAFVLNTLANTISVIDVAGRTVIRTIPTDPGPARGSFNRRGDRLYVVHEAAPYVTVIDPRTLAVTGRLPVPLGMEAIHVDPGTDLVYLGGGREPAVGVHEPFVLGAIDFLDTGAGIAHMVSDGDESALYLASPDTDRVVVFHRLRRRLVGELDVGAQPAWVSVMGETLP